MKKRLLFIGFGWLGQQFALQCASQYDALVGVKRVITTRFPLPTNVLVIPLQLTEATDVFIELKMLEETPSHCVIALPPSQFRDNTSYLNILENLAKSLFERKVPAIFVSSIGARLSKPTQKSVFLETAEKIFNVFENVTILRMAGLIGADRHPAKSLASSRRIINGKESINLVHLTDCIAAIQFVFENRARLPKVVTAVAPFHPSKAEYYTNVARQMNLALPSFKNFEVETTHVIERDLKDFGYQYQRPEL